MSNEKTDLKKLVSALAPIAEVFLEFLMKKWGIRNPVEVLEECIERREWFKGVVLSTAFFEGIGKTVLSGHFKEQISSERFKNLRLELILMFLQASGIIDQPTYSDMMQVKDYRDAVVHLEPFTEPKLEPEKAEKIIRKAISCLQTLIEKLPASEEKLFELPPKPPLKLEFAKKETNKPTTF